MTFQPVAPELRRIASSYSWAASGLRLTKLPVKRSSNSMWIRSERDSPTHGDGKILSPPGARRMNMRIVDLRRGNFVVAKKSLWLIAPVLLVAFQAVPASACMVVGYKNGEPLCATTSDGPGQPYTDARVRSRLTTQSRLPMNKPFARFWAQRSGEPLLRRNTFARFWAQRSHEPLLHRNNKYRGWNW